MPRRNRDSAPRRGKPDAAELARTTALLRRVRAGDTDAFEELVHLYRSHVAGIAYRIVRDYDDAKDVTQMVFVKLYHNLRRYDPDKRFTTWLYRIATNAAIDYVRKFKKQKFELLEETWGLADAESLSPAHLLAYRMLKEHVLKAADRLSFKQRTVFVLRDVDGLDIAEVAVIMDMPQATVRWYLHRARQRLRQELHNKYPHLLAQLGRGF